MCMSQIFSYNVSIIINYYLMNSSTYYSMQFPAVIQFYSTEVINYLLLHFVSLLMIDMSTLDQKIAVLLNVRNIVEPLYCGVMWTPLGQI